MPEKKAKPPEQKKQTKKKPKASKAKEKTAEKPEKNLKEIESNLDNTEPNPEIIEENPLFNNGVIEYYLEETDLVKGERGQPTEKDETSEITAEEIEQAKEFDEEQLYAQLEKWQAARKFNQNLQADYSEEITKWRTQRDQFKDQIRELREKGLEEKAKRDEINSEVTKLKEDRSAANAQIAELKEKRNSSWEQVKSIRLKLKEIIERRRTAKEKLRPVYPLIKRLEEIDWTIMTTSMSFEKEQALMNDMENIIAEISKTQGDLNLEDITIDFEEAKKQIEELKVNAQQFHELMLQTVADSALIHSNFKELVQESEKHHQAMQEYFSKIEELRPQEEEAHQNMLAPLKELELLRQGMEEIYKEIRVIEKKFNLIKQMELTKKVQADQQILDSKTEAAYAKYQDGKKLSMDEFGLLMKKGLIK